MINIAKAEEIRITFKKDEEWLKEYAMDHSSPAAWCKDLMIADYRSKQKKENESTGQSFDLFD